LLRRKLGTTATNSRKDIAIAIDNGDHPIDDEVLTSFRKVMYHNISRACGITRSHASSLLHYCYLGYSNFFYNLAKTLDEAMVYKVSRTPIKATRHVVFQGFRLARIETARGAGR
jgi:hypothetical protein